MHEAFLSLSSSILDKGTIQFLNPIPKFPNSDFSYLVFSQFLPAFAALHPTPTAFFPPLLNAANNHLPLPSVPFP